MAKMKTYSIKAKSDDKYKVEITSGDRTLYVDQPLFVGGTDAGASPMDYLFSSLAGCIATTARIIATQKKLSLNGMDITVEGSLDLDIIYGKNRDCRPGVTGINVSMALDSEMSESERKSFFEEIQVRCPLLDTIASATPITLAAV
ncbi:MAG TPA: OsmC family protein [Dongiaceae bacterium]|nr:OsmC family protein [Dongiaceae bacterium]